MMDYFVTCTIISVCCLFASLGMKSAPSRLNFYVIMLALIAWFVPWQYFSQLPLFESTSQYTVNVAEFSFLNTLIAPTDAQVITSESSIIAPVSWLPSLNHIFSVLLFSGIGLFTLRVAMYVKLVKNLKANSSLYSTSKRANCIYPIRFTSIGGPAFATGLVNPVVWLTPEMENRKELNSVIEHELTHLQQGDIYWTWLICFIESVFWWNPICSKLARLAKEQLELSCDEKCMRKLKGKYQLDLASLLLSEHEKKSKYNFFTPPLLNIEHSKSFNIQRIKMLNKEKTMKSKHMVMALAALSFSALAAAQIVDENPKNEQHSAQKQPAASNQYNQQLAQLLEVAGDAKSDQPTQLIQTAKNIQKWYANRDVLSGFEEGKIKLESYTLLVHVFSKLEQYEDILSAYETWYPAGSNPPYFTKNSLANAYIQLGRYELAIAELEGLSRELDGNLHEGSAGNLALAYIYSADYDKALDTLQQASLEGSAYGDVLKYYIFDQQNNQTKMAELKGRLPAAFAVTPALLPRVGIPQSPLLAKL